MSSSLRTNDQRWLGNNLRSTAKLLLVIALSFMFSGCATMKSINMLNGGEVIDNENKNSTDIPFTLHGHLILVKVKLNNDQQDRIFMVDTGAVTAINKTLAETMSFKDEVEITAKDLTGHEKKIKMVELESLTIGSKEVKKCAVGIVDLKSIELSMGIHLDGIIGSNVLHFFNVTLDYKNRIMTFSQDEQSMSRGTCRIPFKQNLMIGFAPIVEIQIENKYALSAEIDTGYVGYFAGIPGPVLKKLKFPRKVIKGASKGGVIDISGEGELARLKSFVIGNLPMITNVPVESINFDKVLLGKQFLERFVVNINYLSNELVLDPIDENFKFKDNIFSIGIGISRDEKERIKVVNIIQDSPAEKFNIHLGDEIVKLNRKTVGSYSMLEMREILLNDDIKRIELGIKRDDIEQNLVLDKAYLF